MSSEVRTPVGAMIGEEERLARAMLTCLVEPGELPLLTLVHRHGAETVLRDLREGRLETGRSSAWRVRLGSCDPAGDLSRAAQVGARLVCPGDAEWPQWLDGLADVVSSEGRGGVPVGLWVRGQTQRLDDLCERSVAIVGSRNATAYGATLSGDLAYGLSLEDVTVVSGAAYGIDVAAHKGALAAEGPTVAVLACGVDVGYPRGHVALLERIAAEGLVVSELPPGCSPSRLRFLMRNRIIAALTRGSVVVEAALRSGALNTAQWAHGLMRPVLGLPGPVTSPNSAGVHQLVRDRRAELVTDAAEVLEAVSPIGQHIAPVHAGERRPRDRLNERAQRVLEAVPVRQPAEPARIAVVAGLPVTEVGDELEHLRHRGFVERRAQGWRQST